MYHLQDLKGTLAQELDFENEGRNSERCAQELKHFHYVVVPRVHWDKSSKVGWVELSLRVGQHTFAELTQPLALPAGADS